jgi:2-amino-4-hydroxy-6-hydroxymethyldihydropteridine diphosphokinase
MPVFLSLGSNLGHREKCLQRAVQRLEALPSVTLLQSSRYYETEPIGSLDQPAFLNLAVEIETVLAPLELLNAVKGIEAELGRTESYRWGPREIDIDLILWDAQVMDSEELTLPHREFRHRAFVLAPLAEIAPDVVDPVSGKTVAELAASPEARGTVRRLDTITP